MTKDKIHNIYIDIFKNKITIKGLDLSLKERMKILFMDRETKIIFHNMKINFKDGRK